MRKVLSFFIIIVLLAFHVVPVMAVDDVFYETFSPFTNVDLDKEWRVLFNHGDIENNVKAWIEDSSKTIVPTRQRIEDNTLIIEPINNYMGNEEYTLYIGKTSSQKLYNQEKVVFTTRKITARELDPDVQGRIKEIKGYWDSIKPINKEIEYIEKPSSVFPYSLGKLTDETLKNALNVTNFVRYVAYLPSDVKLNEQFNREAQAASVVNAANNLLTHYPTRPKDMDNSLYELGSYGARTSNLGQGFRSIVDSIIMGYMYDGDSSNIDRVGHRLWVLSPKLKEVGFGYATSKDNVGFTGMKVISDNMHYNSEKYYDYISWPAKTAMPAQLFTKSYPWSVSLNPEIYNRYEIDNVKVELTRMSDNKTWTFSKDSKDGYFNIGTGNYGYLPFTIIFSPDDMPTYNSGDHYKVTISNLRKINGEYATISFDTVFFNLNDFWY